MISVIIPTHNEATHLAVTLAAVKANRPPHEVIVVDAASEDGTPSLAVDGGARLFASPRCQRASQMNLGVHHASGETLVFLHADTLLSPAAFEKIEEAMRDPAVAGGAFARRFQSRSLFLRLTCGLAEVRARYSGWFLGDQAIFVRRKVFDELGGYRDFDLFEDLDFARRLRSQGRVVTLRPHVYSSGRRFDRFGPIRTTLADFLLTLQYLRGADPNVLAKRFKSSPPAAAR